MNWLGKIFVVLIAVMSVVFMTLALVVYATHKNWKDLVEGTNGLKAQLAQSQASLEQKQTQFNQLETDLTGERDAARNQLAKVETERVALDDRNKAIQTELDQLKQERREATAAVAATQENNRKLAQEVTGLREDIRSNQQARDQAFQTTLQATEELHQVKGQLDSAVERSRQLSSQVAGMKTVMDANGVDPNADPNAVVPRVDGIVSQVKQTTGAQLVEVTIGADDGLKQGNTVEVYRGDKYLGRIEIVKTSPDRAVGRVDRRFQTGVIQEGDRVATRLKVD
jgi:predicted  nucleic acid-binding Zn-ribbon protein